LQDPFSILTMEEAAQRIRTCRIQLIRLGVVRVHIGRHLPMGELTVVELDDRTAHMQALLDTRGQPESVRDAAVEAAALRREFEVLHYLLQNPHASMMSTDTLGPPPVSEGPVVVLPVGGPSSAVVTLPRARRAAPVPAMAMAA
jgi:hypothetical protein